MTAWTGSGQAASDLEDAVSPAEAAACAQRNAKHKFSWNGSWRTGSQQNIYPMCSF